VRGATPQCAARFARWGYYGLPSQRAVRVAKMKLIVASCRALCKCTVKFLQRMGVSALHAPPPHGVRLLLRAYFKISAVHVANYCPRSLHLQHTVCSSIINIHYPDCNTDWIYTTAEPMFKMHGIRFFRYSTYKSHFCMGARFHC
jgi:hypothetical protein